ncbi:serine hydrolase [Rhodococcus opacus]|uniref:serine hydrolase n=1 Tax=Rhodococcus opacus TaxID=37919 RepID=UPI001F53FD49|nr:serine hydrolase [Rhodococcus opacus]
MTRKLGTLTAANTDGGAHPKALQRLGVTEPDASVSLEQMVTAMIQESDNAVPDYLRDRLGDATYRERVMRMSPGDDFPAVTARVQESGVAGSAAGLASLHRAIASGDFGPGSDVARRTLEWQPAPPGWTGWVSGAATFPEWSPRR